MTKLTKWVLFGFLMLLIGISIGGSEDVAKTDIVEAPFVARESVETLADPAVPVAGETTGTSDLKFETAKVVRVIDGDTVEIEGGQKVRYIGIDTPETVSPRKPVQCFGAEASKKNKELVEGKVVRMEKDVTDKDRYGRLLRYIYIGDSFINVEMVKQGFAYSYSYPPDISRQAQILKAQQEAESAKRGLWSACPTKDSSTTSSTTTTPPASTTSTSSSGSSCNIKGNISSSGEKIYHVEGCGSYSKTVIDESKGEKMFCSETEALNAGWRKALNCP
ncbi:MAG: thermonuclease family protein [Minisyncoccia bacterium]